MNLCDINTIRPLLRRHGFSFSKSMGQNFLCDEAVPSAIVRSSGIDSETCVFEVGPGIGALTQQLCSHAKAVLSLELDKKLLPILGETMSGYDNLHIIPGDVLQADISALCREYFADAFCVCCANLPYYITTPAITALIDSRAFSQITLMVQKEVARRICASPGSKDYGAFTLYINYHAQAEIILDVPRDAFIPAPNVDSAVISLRPLPAPPVSCDEKLLFFIIKSVFTQRRKTLSNNLHHALSGKLTKNDIDNLLISTDINPNIRGENLSLKDFSQIAEKLALFL